MPLEPFDEKDQEGLRFLGFTISVTREQGDIAVVAGEMKVELHRSGIYADELTLIITLPNGREFVAHAPRDELKDLADEAFDE